MAYNSEQAATLAYVFMIQSLLSPLKEIVHIMPLKKIDGEKLFAVVKKAIVELDGIGFKVIGVVSDNNSINRKAMSNFSVPPKLSIVYPHPSDTSNPLNFVIDSVHIFKCIRNNWINQKMQVLAGPGNAGAGLEYGRGYGGLGYGGLGIHGGLGYERYGV
ncbi:THAP-type domain-containing protein [Trichonephila clavipes]|nr:THAP-type domain-containing protein [Trichonephila clavipes]